MQRIFFNLLLDLNKKNCDKRLKKLDGASHKQNTYNWSLPLIFEDIEDNSFEEAGEEGKQFTLIQTDKQSLPIGQNC